MALSIISLIHNYRSIVLTITVLLCPFKNASSFNCRRAGSATVWLYVSFPFKGVFLLKKPQVLFLFLLKAYSTVFVLV